ncbi:MAG: CaiB/BaiF CoA-transferase family protein [Clostridia bacterium]|nr:CaiB/BaiF CoA-transferase family protein [Clostridia bacterium]
MVVDPNGKNFFANVRILELAGELGGYTGKLFANLGADVIRIELPDGDPTRHERPFIEGAPDKEKSIRYQYLNTNKRGVVLDLTKPEGKDIFYKLVKTADCLIEGFAPGYMDSLGLGYEQLNEFNPKLVYTAITPYGQNGPYKDYPYSDLISMAMGGFLFLAGNGDNKPCLAPDKQSYFMADLYAAYGGIVAMYHADNTGEGQFVDVSVQESVATALENAIQTFDLEGKIRRAFGAVEAGTGTYLCQDGYVYMMAAMGTNSYLWDPVVKWLIEEKIPDAELLSGKEWLDPNFRRIEQNKATFKRIFEHFSKQHTKNYLYVEGQKRKAVIYPVNSAKDVLENEQLLSREFFKKLAVEHLGKTVTYPGSPFRLEKMPWALKQSAPVFGQDTERILAECKYSDSQIKSLAERGVIYVK